MKIIKTDNFLKKEAQFNGMPGDPGLPPGVTNRMIDEQFGDGGSEEYTKQSGEHEFQVDWATETTELINAGYDVQGLPQQGIGNLVIYYEYDADVYGEEVTINNLRLLDMKVWQGNQYQPLTVSDPSTKEGIFEGFQDKIVEQEKIIVEEYHQANQQDFNEF
jgi:hypothetical protein